jgi:hypothetical protein
MTQRELDHGLVPGPTGIAGADAADIRLLDRPGIKEVVRRSDGAYTRTDVEDDRSLLIYKGRCSFRPFTPPGPPGQPYRGW